MSSESDKNNIKGEKQPRQDDGGASVPLPAAKRPKTNTDSLLLRTESVILRKILSFLTLKEALPLRQVHRQWNQASSDIYRYSVIKRGMCNESISKESYLFKQRRALCDINDAEKIRAVLRNETLEPDFVASFVHHVIKYASGDNGQAVSALLEDERCTVNIEQLHILLRERPRCNTMIGALQQDDRVKKDIQMCATCSSNIGSHACANRDGCVTDDNLYFCRECVNESDNRLCTFCEMFVCPDCYKQRNCNSCVNYEDSERCNFLQCCHQDCLHQRSDLASQCALCDRIECDSCIDGDAETWVHSDAGSACPSCSRNAVATAIEAANREE